MRVVVENKSGTWRSRGQMRSEVTGVQRRRTEDQRSSSIGFFDVSRTAHGGRALSTNLYTLKVVFAV